MTKVENALPSVIQKALSSVRNASICQSVATVRYWHKGRVACAIGQ